MGCLYGRLSSAPETVSHRQSTLCAVYAVSAVHTVSTVYTVYILLLGGNREEEDCSMETNDTHVLRFIVACCDLTASSAVQAEALYASYAAWALLVWAASRTRSVSQDIQTSSPWASRRAIHGHVCLVQKPR